MENPAVNGPVSAILADPAKWRALLDQFEDVLKINIFIVDPAGQLLVPLNFQKNQQGGGVLGFSLIKKTFGINFWADGGGSSLAATGEFLSYFKPRDGYFQAVDPFDLRLFAVPVRGEAEKTLFYLIVGPLRLGKAWPEDKSLALAKSLGLADQPLLRDMNSVATISEAALNAVLDLLSEVIKDVYELSMEKQKISELQNHDEPVRPDIISAVQGLLTDIQHDELLIAILDAAIKMAGAEGGSIMILDEEKQDLVIKVSRGLDTKKSVVRARFKFGEGIAGIAAEQKTPFFINGTEGDERIRHLLKRPDIRQAFVVPIVSDDKVIAVLNLSIKNPDSAISVSDVQQDIQRFSPLIATALRSV